MPHRAFNMSYHAFLAFISFWSMRRGRQTAARLPLSFRFASRFASLFASRFVFLFAFLLVFLFAGTLVPRSSYAQLPERLSSSARVEVLTMAPGTAVHAVFGHSALRVVDPGLGFDAVFNYGTFNPTNPLFIPKFAYGDMQYFVSVAGGRAVVEAYASEERSVYAQHIRMTPERVAALYAALRTNLEPQNRAYLYDFVRDNCSTRLIDLLSLYAGVRLRSQDGSLMGSLMTSHALESPPSFRSLIRSYLAPYPWLDLGINLILGAPMERPPSPRERTFLPFELMAALDAATVPAAPSSAPSAIPADSTIASADSARLPADSARLPAVLRTDTLFAGIIHGPALPRVAGRAGDTLATRAQGGSARPRFVWPFRLAALLLALIAFLPGRDRAVSGRARRSPTTDRIDRILLWTTSIIGVFLLFMWLGTQHTVTSWNTNLLWAFPLNVLLLRHNAVRTLSAVAAACCALAALTPVLPLQSVPAAIWPFTLLLGALHVRRIAVHINTMRLCTQ